MPSIFLLLLIEFINQFNYCSLYLFYELKYIQGKNTIESMLSFNSTYTDLEIGTPPQKVNIYFTLEHHQQISLTKDNCPADNSFFPNISSTFKGPFRIEAVDKNDKHEFLFTDSLIAPSGMINFSQNIELDEFPLFSIKKINSANQIYYCGYIGLAIVQYGMYSPEEKIIQKVYSNLEKYGVKRNDDFSFFSHKGKDYIIYGKQLHNLFPDYFKDIKGVEWIHPSNKKNSYDLFWAIYMKDVYYNNVYSDPNKFETFEINPLFELIIATNEFKGNITKDYFQEYFNKDICFIEDYTDYNYKIFACYDNKFNVNDIKKFPNIYITNLGIHYTFELKGEELFRKIDDKWYFQIIFPVNNLDQVRWILGRIFLRKYPITFSPSSRLLGFYLNKKVKSEKDIKEANEEKKILIIAQI